MSTDIIVRSKTIDTCFMFTGTEEVESDKKLYRYEDVHYSRGVDEYDDPLPGGHICVELREYPILKRTPKGVWISECWRWGSPLKFAADETRQDRGERFILLSARKKFAAETKEQALEDYKARKRAQIRILKAKMRAAESALNAACNDRMESYY